MQTLLEKVKNIEDEAASVVEVAKVSAQGELATIQKNEERALSEIQLKASANAKDIIAGHVEKANREKNDITQSAQHSTKAVHSSAEQNRASAVTKAYALFQEKYVTKEEA